MKLTNAQLNLLTRLNALMPSHKFQRLEEKLKAASKPSETFILLGEAADKYLLRPYGEVTEDFFDEVCCCDSPDLIG